MPKKPKGFGKFDKLMRKLVKVPPKSLDDLTPKQIKAFGDEISEADRQAMDGRLGPNFIKRLLESHPPRAVKPRKRKSK